MEVRLDLDGSAVERIESVAKTFTSRSEVHAAPIRTDGVEVEPLEVWTVGE